jgi:putative FmdB family regulatory protein
MAMYGFRCAVDGPFDVRLPIGTAPAALDCPSCGEPSRRVFSSAMLGFADRGRMSVLDHCERSRHAPEVVSAPAGTARKRTPTAPANPKLARLPRP